MIVFWLISTILAGIALILILRPLLGGKPADDISRRELNIALYRQRLQELQLEHESGVIGDDQFQQTRHELERSLLQDVPDEDADSKAITPVSTKTALISTASFILLVAGMYWLIGDIHYLSPERKAVQIQQQRQAMLIAGIDELQAHLKTNPRDAEAWALLGRSYLLLGRFQQAVASYEKAYQLTGGRHPQLLADYAESLARANGGNLSGRPLELAKRALQLDANNQSALWLVGFAAFQQRDYRSAINYWRRLYRIQQQRGQVDPALKQFLGQAEQRAGVAVKPGPKLVVKISLSPALQRQVRASDTVFIFARAANGPRMPLAILRKKAGKLPFKVVLDDSHAMRPGMALSNFDQVFIEARISRSGTANRQKGDLYGRSPAVRVARNRPVVIVIRNRVQ